VLRECVPNLRHGPVPIGGQRLYQDRYSAGGVALEDGLVKVGLSCFAASLGDSPLDVLPRNALGLGFGDGRPQPSIPRGIRTAEAGRDGNLFEQPREELATPGVGDRLLALDLRPLAVARHERDLL